MPTDRPFDAVLFDLDGTLLDTLRDIGEACNRVLIERGFPPHPIESYRYLVGDGARVLLSRALPEGSRDDATIDACLADYTAEYARGWNVHTQPYAGIGDLLDALVERGLKLAVLSNKAHPFTVQCVETFLARWQFHAVRGQTNQFPRKPDPASALDVARQLCIAPQWICYVGDTGTDMQTATAAGMVAVGVLWGFRDRKELLANGAKHIIAYPRELLPLIK
ncbi:MAG TPA: HAD family hydrolase [Tepidisphaeraceae bacterium]|nr:HAD family hydrolase [Tepidisphaeraceae bacterium]